ALLDARTALDFLVIGLRIAATALEQIVERRDDAHADRVVWERDVPEPAVLVPGLDHKRRAPVSSGIPVRAFPVLPDRTLVHRGIPDSQPQPVHQQAVLAAGI